MLFFSLKVQIIKSLQEQPDKYVSMFYRSQSSLVKRTNTVSKAVNEWVTGEANNS